MENLSEAQEEKYSLLNTDADIADFFKAEEKSLYTQCNTLIQFIKFLQMDPKTAAKLKTISSIIMDLQKEF